MIKGFILTYYKQFEGEWYTRTINCKAFEDVEKAIEDLPNQYKFTIQVLRDTKKGN